MRGVFVGIVGAAAILLSIAALVEHEQRAGPIDTTLEPVALDIHTVGTYHARPANEPVAGLCPTPPCEPHTDIDLRFEGLPPAAYTARLDGSSSQGLGPLKAQGDAQFLQWTERSDHTDKDRLVIVLAGRDIASFAVGPRAEPRPIDQTVAGSWDATPVEVHFGEIGGITISTVAKARLADAPPDGWAFYARLEGPGGTVEMGPLERGENGAVLDARVERVALEDQERMVVDLRPVGAAQAGFPVLATPI